MVDIGRERKLEYHQERKEAIDYLRPRWRKCFWTWPWGHQFDVRIDRVYCCRFCRRPQFLDKTSTSEIIDLGM